MMDAITTRSLAGVESAINKALAYDPASQRALARLAGRAMLLEVQTPAITLAVIPNPHGVELRKDWEGTPDIRLRGALTDMVRLALGEQNQGKAKGVTVEGNTDTLLQLRQILHTLDIDWEEALSEPLGDVAGHWFAERIRSLGHWTRERAKSTRQLSLDFITEEQQWLPSRNEVEDFYRALDRLRLDLDRTEARVRQWIEHRQGATDSASQTGTGLPPKPTPKD